jgi:hypothetical protein
MTKLLLQLAFIPLVFGSVHADENPDYLNANMLWSDNEEFHQVNAPADEKPGYRNANMLWSDNEEFHRVNTPPVDTDFVNSVNSNMSWADDEEFQSF